MPQPSGADTRPAAGVPARNDAGRGTAHTRLAAAAGPGIASWPPSRHPRLPNFRRHCSETKASPPPRRSTRSEEHTSELQSLMRISYAVFCLKKKKTHDITKYQKYTKTTIYASEI